MTTTFVDDAVNLSLLVNWFPSHMFTSSVPFKNFLVEQSIYCLPASDLCILPGISMTRATMYILAGVPPLVTRYLSVIGRGKSISPICRNNLEAGDCEFLEKHRLGTNRNKNEVFPKSVLVQQMWKASPLGALPLRKNHAMVSCHATRYFTWEVWCIRSYLPERKIAITFRITGAY